jgi:hypothetical protein
MTKWSDRDRGALVLGIEQMIVTLKSVEGC